MPFPVITIDLETPPSRRWEPLKPYAAAAREMVEFYLRDLGSEGKHLEPFAAELLPREFRGELDGMSELLAIEPGDLLVANLYYDAIKAIIGCTAFSVETPHGPLHARNLDWWGDDDILTKNTAIFDFCRSGETVYQIVGWPGFAGAFSGVAPGRFAVTLNAVSSDEPAQLGKSVTFLIRETLENARDFEEAVATLRDTVIPCDCLLLVTGPAKSQRVVIERTPTTSAVRYPEIEILVVANSYQALRPSQQTATLLGQTSCGRSGRARELIAKTDPQTPEDCFRILSDSQVEMSITAQSMVFQASSGLLDVRAPRL